MNSAAEQIRKEIAAHGAIPFARFMELALFCPLCGYYEKKRDTPGRRGDYFTSVSVGEVFGQLLAFQFAEWLGALQIATGGWQIVEAGAHDGQLAKDILTWLRCQRPALFDRIEYWIIEPSARRQVWQRETLQDFGPRVRWFADFHSLASPSPCAATHPQSEVGNRKSVCGVIFCNELLDALPVQRIGWDARRRAWFEWGVTLEDERLVWTRLHGAKPASDFVVLAPPALLNRLPDGFTIDTSPAAAQWWRTAAQQLQCGKLLTLDYGLSAEAFFALQRANGTLRAYRRHRFADDLLANPGEQDLTAHVNFTMLRVLGERAGLTTETDSSQAAFLTGIARRVWAADSGFGPWTPRHTRQFQTLTHPEHLGRPFRVLVQSAGGR